MGIENPQIWYFLFSIYHGLAATEDARTLAPPRADLADLIAKISRMSFVWLVAYLGKLDIQWISSQNDLFKRTE